MNKKTLLLLFATCCLLSCSPKKKQLSFYGNDNMEVDSVTNEWVAMADESNLSEQSDNKNQLSDREVVVPFEESRGVKLVDVTVNGQFTVKIVLDSGCSGTQISIAEAKYLYEKGCFTEDDILGTTTAQIADGSIVENMAINLRELVIGNQISCSNVTATVSANAQAPLLLGNEVLDRVPSYSIDNVNKVVRFKLQ